MIDSGVALKEAMVGGAGGPPQRIATALKTNNVMT
jgi:hypothetical protein